jgi:hypothetical protein
VGEPSVNFSVGMVTSTRRRSQNGEVPGPLALVLRGMAWLRTGYPAAAPGQGYLPLLALLPRRLTDLEVALIARTLREAGIDPPARVDIGQLVARVTGELPTEEDIGRVAAALARNDAVIRTGRPDDRRG